MTTDPRLLAVVEAEAVVGEKRRRCAEEGGRHRPALAKALHDLGLALERADRGGEALAAAHDSVATLAPDFLARPGEFAVPMRTAIAQYVGLAGRSGATPDESLLAPVAQALGDMLRAEDAADDDG